MNTPQLVRRLARAFTVIATTVVMGFVVSGCAPAASGSSGTSPSPPSATSSAASSPTPTVVATPSSGATTAPEGGNDHTPVGDNPSKPTNAATGCPANDATIPEDADVTPIEDVDSDGALDTQFFSENPEFVYGISTASGATYFLADTMAGPNKHYGWTALLESDVALTVLDDSRGARVHAFVDCAFVTPLDETGTPLSPALHGLGDSYTGLQCFSGNGGRSFYGMHVVALDGDGRYTVTRTPLAVSADGAILTSSDEELVAADIPADDPRVMLASRSTCEDVPKVATSGR